jgi:maleylacetoacetate isomerase
MSLTLFHYWRSSASWRVRWGLEIKKVPHEKVAVDLLAGQEGSPDYLKRNPAGYVPCLIAGANPPLGESLAILEWLEENYPSPSLFSGDSFLRARIRQLAETVNSGIQPLQNLSVIRKLSEDKHVQKAWMQHWMGKGLAVYEDLLSRVDRRGARFSVADHPTLADLCLIPQCYASLRFDLDLSAFPQCEAIYEHALTTSECLASHPDQNKPS